MMTKTLADFLLARIAEDKADAIELLRQHERWEREQDQNGADGSQGSIVVSLLAGGPSDPARILAEVESKRKVLHLVWALLQMRVETAVADQLLRLLALPYVEHPDYREEWRP